MGSTSTVVLLSAAGLLARSFLDLTGGDLGFDPDNVLTVNIGLDGEPYDERGTEYSAFYQQVIERLEGTADVQSAAAGQSVPVIGPFSTRTPFQIGDGTDLASSWWQDSGLPSTAMRMVTPGYFRTLEIPLVRGRDFNATDRRESPSVFIVNEAFTAAFLPDGDALGAPLSVFMNNVPGIPTARGRIIGIVGDVREGSLRGQAEPTLFYNYSQLSSSTDMLLFVRAGNTAGVPDAISEAVQTINPNVPVTDPQLLDDVFEESIARERLNAFASAALAVTALLLATSGIYGLLSFMVTERKREIAIRMALGARVSEVQRMVLGQSLWLLIPGVTLGLTGAVAFGAVIESLLYGIAPHDPLTLASVVALMVGIGVLAAFLPARRATEVHPLEALRQE